MWVTKFDFVKRLIQTISLKSYMYVESVPWLNVRI